MAAQAALISASEYLAIEEQSLDQHEFVNGRVYLMSGGSSNHAVISRNLTVLLAGMLADGECMNLGRDVKIAVGAANSYFYADASISCPPSFVDRRHGVIDNPRVLFEVLSPSTESLDRGPKFDYYRSLDSLRDYVLIDTDAFEVEVFSLEEGKWHVRKFSGPGAEAAIPSVEVRLPLSDLYGNVVFDED